MEEKEFKTPIVFIHPPPDINFKKRTMGVMACGKKGCENILCDTYIPNIGYVCLECQEQFRLDYQRRHRGEDNKISPIVFTEELGRFLELPKIYSGSLEEKSINEFFNDYTK